MDSHASIDSKLDCDPAFKIYSQRSRWHDTALQQQIQQSQDSAGHGDIACGVAVDICLSGLSTSLVLTNTERPWVS
jgi:hypothetical protein